MARGRNEVRELALIQTLGGPDQVALEIEPNAATPLQLQNSRLLRPETWSVSSLPPRAWLPRRGYVPCAYSNSSISCVVRSFRGAGHDAVHRQPWTFVAGSHCHSGISASSAPVISGTGDILSAAPRSKVRACAICGRDRRPSGWRDVRYVLRAARQDHSQASARASR